MQFQKFGLELRRIGNVDNLYADVDRTLNACNVSPNSVSMKAQIQTVAHALQQMFKVNKHFSVCTIRNCASLCQICVSKERMDLYSSIHCMDWNEMLPEYRNMVVAMVLDDFRAVLNPQK